MGDKPEFILKKMTKEEKAQQKKENQIGTKPKIVIIMVIGMILIMAGMLSVSYFWSMKKLSPAIAFPVMGICLAAEVVLCQIANKINHNMDDK